MNIVQIAMILTSKWGSQFSLITLIKASIVSYRLSIPELKTCFNTWAAERAKALSLSFAHVSRISRICLLE